MKEESEEIEKMCNWSEVRLQQGREEGKVEGREERDQEVALNMLKDGIDFNLITRWTGVSLKRLLEMKQKFEHQEA